MSEIALVLSILAFALLGLLGYITYSLAQSVTKLAKEIDKLADRLESVDKSLERQRHALHVLDQKVNARPSDPVQALLSLIPGARNAKWTPILALAAKSFAAYLGKKARQRSALKPRNVNNEEGASSEAPDQGGKV